jgi:polyisoprenoid-binding protein YceI
MSAVTAPTTGTWVADPVHSAVSFRVRHLGVGRIRGTFDLSSAELVIGADGAAGSRVRAVIDAATVRTGNDQRDTHVRSPDFLDVETYPSIEFVSTEIRDVDGDTFTMAGELTVHGVTRAVDLECEFLGVTGDPAGGERAGFSASASISRAAFGVDIRLVAGAGELVVADAVEITIDIEFTIGGGNAS